MLVLYGIEVDEKWDHKVLGLHVGSSLAGCGGYVEFIPMNPPHSLGPAKDK